MTYKLSNYLFIESFSESHDYTNGKVRLVSLANLKKTKNGGIVKDCEFYISNYDIITEYTNLKTRLSDEEKLKQSDIDEIVELLKSLEIEGNNDSNKIVPTEITRN